MKKRVGAFLLALVLVLGAIPGALAAGTGAMAVDATHEDDVTTVVVTLAGVEGVTNGRFQVTYNAQAVTLSEVIPGDENWIASVNDEEAGVVFFAWVGSSLTDEETVMVTLTFSDIPDANVFRIMYTAECMELFAADAEGTAAVELQTSSAQDAVRYGDYGDGSTVVVGPGTGSGNTGNTDVPSDTGNTEDAEDTEDTGDTAPTFEDISGHWAEPYIEKVYAAGLVSGTGDGTTYEPNTELNRGMFVTILYRNSGSPEAEDAGFTDVAESSWYAKAANWAMSLGVTSGTGDGTTFSPMQNITREQLVTMVYRYAVKMGMDVPAHADLQGYADADQVSDWAVGAMEWAVGAGIISGTSSSTLSPSGTATRGEMAAILCRFLGL